MDVLDQDTLKIDFYYVGSLGSEDAQLSKAQDEIQRVSDQFKRLVNPFITHYPFQGRLDISENKATNGLTPFLSVSLNFGENYAEEWLLICLAFKTSQNAPNVFIRVIDFDGEVLLIESADAVPEWLVEDYRTWVNNGRVQIISEDVRIDTLGGALISLKDRSNLVTYGEIDRTITFKLSTAVEDALKTVRKEKLFVPAEWDQRLNGAIPEAVADYCDMIQVLGKTSAQRKVDKLSKDKAFGEEVDIWIPITTLMKLRLLHSENSLTDALRLFHLDPEASYGNGDMDALQEELIRDGVIEKKVSPMSLEDIEDTEIEEKDEMQELLDRFKEMMESDDLEKRGAESFEDNSDSDESDEDLQRGTFRQDNDDSGNLNEPHSTHQTDPVIDEDDFFEFFLKDALGLSERELESLRAGEDPYAEDTDHNKAGIFNDEGGASYAGDASDIDDADDEVTENLGHVDTSFDPDAIMNMMKSLQEGSADGAANIFMNLMDMVKNGKSKS